jgi:hypothetical protein
MSGAKKMATTQHGINKGMANMEDLKLMIAAVKKETGWRDIHKIVDEALKRIKNGKVPEPKFITSVSERPTYIRHWEVSLPDGNQIRILSENGLEIINCRWPTYRRNNSLKEELESDTKK